MKIRKKLFKKKKRLCPKDNNICLLRSGRRVTRNIVPDFKKNTTFSEKEEMKDRLSDYIRTYPPHFYNTELLQKDHKQPIKTIDSSMKAQNQSLEAVSASNHQDCSRNGKEFRSNDLIDRKKFKKIDVNLMTKLLSSTFFRISEIMKDKPKNDFSLKFESKNSEENGNSDLVLNFVMKNNSENN